MGELGRSNLIATVAEHNSESEILEMVGVGAITF
jgi:hypothetical protein